MQLWETYIRVQKILVDSEKNLETISICKENILPQDSNLWYE
jgi:hypothetical protein